MEEQDCAGFEFFSNFDSANLAKIEYVPPSDAKPVPSHGHGRNGNPPEVIDVEFNIWTKPDCCGTEFENGNRTWFYFGVRANSSGLLVKINMVDINRQAKMYSQGMAPVFRIVPGKPHWERVRDKPTYAINDNIFTLSFKYRTPENIQSIVYFAFTYPYTYTELTSMLGNIDTRFEKFEVMSRDDIYYTREAVCFTLDGRRVELMTISSYHNISSEREVRLKNLFPEETVARPFRFIGKKVIFVSARVHPGETPSSFVFNGFLNMLLNREDPLAIALRRHYVFKLIPMLNPDGVAKGHYRTDTRGVNLNRVYLNPSFTLHPPIYAARALIRYYHYGYEKEEEINEEEIVDTGIENDDEAEDGSSVEDNRQLSKKVSHMSLEENKKKKDGWCNKCKGITLEDVAPEVPLTLTQPNSLSVGKGMCTNCGVSKGSNSGGAATDYKCEHGDHNFDSGIFMYMDMHGHASKKGIFMYGNHFDDLEQNIDCMLLPKIMSLNNHNFHFTACNFTERNMYLKDRRDGMSREGSGRVAVLKLTGLIRSYTLECNYNTGRLVNVLPSTIRESNSKTHSVHVPPKYTPHVFEEVGKALGASILDLTAQNPLTRLPNSQFHSLNGLRDWIRVHCMNDLGETRFTSTKYKLRNSSNLHAQVQLEPNQPTNLSTFSNVHFSKFSLFPTLEHGMINGKSGRAVVVKTRSTTLKGTKRMSAKGMMRSTSVPIERKENIYEHSDIVIPQPSCSNVVPVPKHRPKSFSMARSKIKLKGLANDKTKAIGNVRNAPQTSSFQNKQKLKIDLSSKLQTIKEIKSKGKSTTANEDSKSRPKLQDISFVKSSESKRVIAKLKKDIGEEKKEDDLLVWDEHGDTQVFSNKTKDFQLIGNQAGTSRTNVRINNYAKASSVKLKRSKRPLRRLTTATDAPIKIDKLKKRKIVKNQLT